MGFTKQRRETKAWVVATPGKVHVSGMLRNFRVGKKWRVNQCVCS